MSEAKDTCQNCSFQIEKNTNILDTHITVLLGMKLGHIGSIAIVTGAMAASVITILTAAATGMSLLFPVLLPLRFISILLPTS